MTKKLLELKIEAENRLLNKDVTGSLKIYTLLLETLPLDFNLRFEIADAFSSLNLKKFSNAIYSSIAEYFIKSGDPLSALAAIKILQQEGINAAKALDLLSATYAAGSPSLGRSIKPAPSDYSQEIRDDINLDFEIETEALKNKLATMAAYTGNISNYPKVVPPIAILSTLSQESFFKLVSLLKLKRYKDRDPIINQGDIGSSLFFVARGLVTVVRKDNDKDEYIKLASLGQGSIFGEMALISNDPRGASVYASGECDLLELSKDEVDKLSMTAPNVAGAMARFTKDRMISNLLATNPLFKPFVQEAKQKLLSKFEGHEVPKGTIFVEQGKPGSGLYVILQGQAEVLTYNGSEYIQVSVLGPGDVAGEISLIYDENATATLRTLTPCTLLFLAKELFTPLVNAFPEVLAHFAKMANRRMQDTEEKLEANRFMDGDGIEELDDDDDDEIEEFEELDDNSLSEEELSDDDLIMI
ncbi:MAG: cyclic nucleotide-binding domain-containing protein [Deltaproteobacteria bacterium]|nr:cyclic nucleotide-binding domain-containing protein [Deltaproteobacteria bacterium]